MSEPTVDVRKCLRIALQHVLICGPDAFVQSAIEQVDDAVAELVEADREYDAAAAAYKASILPTVARANAKRIKEATKRRVAALARFGSTS